MGDSFAVGLTRNSGESWGFRLQGGNDFAIPLSIQSVTPGSIADRCGLKAGDEVLRIGDYEASQLQHDQAKQMIVAAGNNVPLVLQRGSMKIWQPKVTPLNELRGNPSGPAGMVTDPAQDYVQKTSLAADKQEPLKINFFNKAPRPFPGSGSSSDNATVPVIANAQYNTPLGMYSSDSTMEALGHQSQSLVGRMEGYPPGQSAPGAGASPMPSGMRSVKVPTAPSGNVQVKPAQHMTCKVCSSLIVGVFVKIGGEPMHPECYKCAGCGNNLKNKGFYNVNGQMYCDSCTQ